MAEPAKVRSQPCVTCPYRLDAPSGLWAAEEYAKLPGYDGPAGQQALTGALGAFHCHSTPERVCAGWAGYRAPRDLLAVRLGVLSGSLDESALSYTCPVPLHPTGAAAAEHGLRDLGHPGEDAVSAAAKVRRLIDAREDRS